MTGIGMTGMCVIQARILFRVVVNYQNNKAKMRHACTVRLSAVGHSMLSINYVMSINFGQDNNNPQLFHAIE